MKVRKRDGSLQEWDSTKIAAAVRKAADACGVADLASESVVRELEQTVFSAEPIPIEEIQDAVEISLMKVAPRTARAYVLYREERRRDREKRSVPDPSMLPDFIHVSKYARYRPELGRRETYLETSHRVRDMHISMYPKMEQIIRETWEMVDSKRVLPSMRSMQFAGDAILVNHCRLYNCAFAHVKDITIFSEIFYLLLCGCGVGYSVQQHHVAMLPMVPKMGRLVRHHVVLDTIEGWANALRELFTATFSGNWVEFNYSLIRPEGAQLVTTGGKAPGHLPLREGIETIRGLLLKAQGRKLQPIEAHDIICHSAMSVLAGGIRRSSLLSLFSPSDTDMRLAKTHGQFAKNPQRAMANNSVMLVRDKEDHKTFENIMRLNLESHGEPGFFFSPSTEYGPNPCGEIGLNSYQFCNLTEINAALCKTKEDLVQAAKAASIIGTLQAGYTTFPYLSDRWKRQTEKEALLGVGITGMADSPEVAFNPDALKAAAEAVVMMNRFAAGAIGIVSAARTTTIKPSGTASLELGCVGSGIHPHHARRYFRRVTLNRNEPIAKFIQRHNPHMVQEKSNGDLVATFPIQAPAGAVTAKETSAMDLLKRVILVHKHWILPGTVRDEITHNVSCTIIFSPAELAGLLETIWEQQESIAAMTLFPRLSDKAFPFAPREEVTTAADEALWNELIDKWTPMDYSTMQENEHGQSFGSACDGGKCEL